MYAVGISLCHYGGVNLVNNVPRAHLHPQTKATAPTLVSSRVDEALFNYLTKSRSMRRRYRVEAQTQ